LDCASPKYFQNFDRGIVASSVIGKECTLLVLFVLQDQGKETIQALLSVELGTVCSIGHIASSDED
jgi:hypothetical protein